MEQHEGYKSLCDRTGRPFRSFRAFCLAKRPYGLEYDHEAVRLIRDEKVGVEERAGEAKELHEQHNKTLVTNVKQRGEDADYLTARIARDRPDILERMKAGAYTSVRQAALEAGIVKARISIPSDADGAARAILRHFDASEIEWAIARLIALEETGSV